MDSTYMPFAVVLVVALVVYRQMRTRMVKAHGLHYFAMIMIVVGLVSGGLVTATNLALSVAMLVVELASAVAFGFVRARTMVVWRDENGLAWCKGTAWTLLGWLASALTRVALLAAGHALGLVEAPTALLFFMGVTIGCQEFLVARRARTMPFAAGRVRSARA
ncbi:hypothetical protein ABZT47_40160 [Sphaerisporangium sp. NPDC005289]|uniref:hypothetical protein n=1 Tax=Sphaerisporangium sp. NPDC005289 TaxID=3155247 RepID=UPI0033B5CCD0